MLIIKSIFQFIVFSFCIFFNKKCNGHYSCWLDEPSKEHNWILAQKLNVCECYVEIGPHMGLPQIHRILRFSLKYKIPTVLVVMKNPWHHDNSIDLKNAYIDWWKNVLNNFEIPKNVLYVKIGVSFIRKKDQRDLVTQLENIDKNTINPINHNIHYMSDHRYVNNSHVARLVRVPENNVLKKLRAYISFFRDIKNYNRELVKKKSKSLDHIVFDYHSLDHLNGRNISTNTILYCVICKNTPKIIIDNQNILNKILHS